MQDSKSMTHSFSPAHERSALENTAILALAVFTAMAVAGYAIFALHPERLAAAPTSAIAYGYAMKWFPPGHIIAGGIALGLVLWKRAGARWIAALVMLYLISLGAEMLGTTSGVPFGPYRYSDGLGIKWFEHVPILIPLSWFVMALPSYALASRWISTRSVARIVAATTLLVAWDLALDPAMSHLMPYWIWGNEGTYYGMPALNLLGWFVTGLALMAALELLRVNRWLDAVPTWPLFGIYAANLALPVLMSAAAGIWPAAVLAMVPIAVAAMIKKSRERRIA